MDLIFESDNVEVMKIRLLLRKVRAAHLAVPTAHFAVTGRRNNALSLNTFFTNVRCSNQVFDIRFEEFSIQAFFLYKHVLPARCSSLENEVFEVGICDFSIFH